MNFLKTTAAAAAMLTGGLFAMTPDTADAQIRVQIGGNGYGYGDGYGFNNGGYRNGGYGYGGPRYRSNGYNYGGNGRRYDGFSNGRGRGYGPVRSGHYDYHPTTVVPHGDHLDVLPGHYDYHQGRHYGH